MTYHDQFYQYHQRLWNMSKRIWKTSQKEPIWRRKWRFALHFPWAFATQSIWDQPGNPHLCLRCSFCSFCSFRLLVTSFDGHAMVRFNGPLSLTKVSFWPWSLSKSRSNVKHNVKHKLKYIEIKSEIKSEINRLRQGDFKSFIRRLQSLDDRLCRLHQNAFVWYAIHTVSLSAISVCILPWWHLDWELLCLRSNEQLNHFESCWIPIR